MSSSPSSRPYDITIFGATGFTGTYIAQYLVKYATQHQFNISIGLAGRSESRLTSLVTRVNSTSTDVKIGVIVANIEDEKSITHMTSQSHIIINAVGPFRFWGETVVKSCIMTKTHYVDITGEPEFIERMILSYDDEARKAGVCIVHSCGFDSVPSDLGAIYTTNEWEKKYPDTPLPHITSYITIRTGPSGGGINFGTWASLIESIAHTKELGKIRGQLKKKQEQESGKIPRAGPPQPPHSMSYESCIERWTVRFMGADASVVKQSQQRMTYQDQLKGIHGKTYPHYSVYLTMASFFWLCIYFLFGGIVKCFASSAWGRQIMLKHPGWFSMGIISTQGPTPQQIDECSFEVEMFASHQKKQLHTVVSGPELGYIATSILVVQSALTIWEEIKQSVEKRTLARGENGGVMTPAAAFASTPLISRLHQENIRFQVIE